MTVLRMGRVGARSRCAGLVLAIAMCGSGAIPAAARGGQGLSEAIEQDHRAVQAILRGDPAPLQRLFADRPDISLGSPFGPYVRGRAEVAEALASAAAKYRDGQVVDVDLIAKYQDGRIASVVEVEHDRTKVGASDVVSDFHLRVTSVYARVAGQWKLVHRHADAMTTARPVEAVLGK